MTSVIRPMFRTFVTPGGLVLRVPSRNVQDSGARFYKSGAPMNSEAWLFLALLDTLYFAERAQ